MARAVRMTCFFTKGSLYGSLENGLRAGTPMARDVPFLLPLPVGLP